MEVYFKAELDHLRNKTAAKDDLSCDLSSSRNRSVDHLLSREQNQKNTIFQDFHRSSWQQVGVVWFFFFIFLPWYPLLVANLQGHHLKQKKEQGELNVKKQISERKKHIEVQGGLSTFKWKIYNEHYGNINIGVGLFLGEVNEGVS